jgi:oxygen-independent coproporphyrinogen-3 oxidase
MEFRMSNENGSRILKRRFLLVYPHSSYALTVEPKTAMNKMIQTENAKRRRGSRTFMILQTRSNQMGLSIMNCPILANRITSKNNPLIGWEKKNMGIGPRRTVIMAFRSWNVSNNIILKSISRRKTTK